MTMHESTAADRQRDDLTGFRDLVWAGLGERPRTLPTQYLYDARGSALFDRICELPEYYLTRTELGIMRAYVDEMAARLGPEVTLIEYGSGSSTKTRMLLRALERPRAYVPVDISADHLLGTADGLRREFPGLAIDPVVADFTAPFSVTAPRGTRRRVVYFPGSTIGNFQRTHAEALLRGMNRLVGREGAVLIGYDLQKPRELLEPAYDDAAGVTAAFDLNLLVRINRELGADFDLDGFRHRAYYDAIAGRVVMTLVSQRKQRVIVAGRPFVFESGEAIRTEYSHKYTPESFASLAAAAGLGVECTWSDANRWFAVALLARQAD